jgi:hypothetical protein
MRLYQCCAVNDVPFFVNHLTAKKIYADLFYYFDSKFLRLYSLGRAPVRALESTDLLFNCTKYGYFNLWEIVKLVATRCQILRLKCTKFYFGLGSAPHHAGGDDSDPRPLAGF